MGPLMGVGPLGRGAACKVLMKPASWRQASAS